MKKNTAMLTRKQRQHQASLKEEEQVGNFKLPDAPESKKGKGKGQGKEDTRRWVPCPLLPDVPTAPPPRILQPWEINRQHSQETADADVIMGSPPPIKSTSEHLLETADADVIMGSPPPIKTTSEHLLGTPKKEDVVENTLRPSTSSIGAPPQANVYCGMVEDLPEGRPLEVPKSKKKKGVLPKPILYNPGLLSVWSSEPESEGGDAASVPAPAMMSGLDDVGSAPSPVMPEPQASGSGLSKRGLIPSSSSSRPLRHSEKNAFLNYGSEEDSGEDDDDEVEPLRIPVPRAARAYINLGSNDEAAGGRCDASLSYSWPPLPSSPVAPIPPPLSVPVPLASSPSSPAPLSPTPVLSPPSTAAPSAFEWRAFPQPQIPPELRRESFSEINCGPAVSFASPYDAFTGIWDREIMEYIAQETNRYAQQLSAVMLEDGTMRPYSRITRWQNVDVEELYVYFAMISAIGIVVKSRLDEYWNKSQDMFSTPGFSTSMSYNRFSLISKCLHFQNNDNFHRESMTRPQAKLFKLQPIIAHLNNKFSSMYTLSQNIALDESLTMWKGWLDINQFISNKAASVGIKTYEVCESHTGYLWRFEVYAGHDAAAPISDDPLSGIVSALVLRLLKGLEHKGHTVWMDNFYNSPALARELKSKGFDCVGTLLTDRQFVPVELTNLKKTDMAVGQVSGCTSGDVDLLVWRHKSRVAFVSTYHGLAATMCGDTLKPTVVQDYNVCMGGVDRKDQMLAMYPIERKRNRIWYKKFFRRLLNASTLNAYILHKHNATTPLTHREFRRSLVCELVARHGKPSPATSTVNSSQHFPAQYGIIMSDSGKREHIRRVCSVCRKRTNVYCMACQVPLCVFTCFQPHHRQ